MRIGLAYNQRPQAITEHRDASHPPLEPSFADDTYVEWDDPATIAAVEEALRAFGEVVRLEAVGDFATRLARADVDLLFNMAEGSAGPSREAHVPAIAEFLGVPYTGSDPLTLALCLHKARAKDVLRQRGIATPAYLTIDSMAGVRAMDDASYPLFLKPVWEGSSKGISTASHVEGPAVARTRAVALLQTYGQPVIAEHYLPGEEFTIAVLGNGPEAECLPIIRYRFETLPDGALPVMGYEAKWIWDTPEAAMDVLECPASIDRMLGRSLRATALAAYQVLGCRDWARVDLRLDGDGVPHVLEVNPLPGVIPDPAANSCFPRAASVAGLSYAALIQTVVRVAWRRLTGRELEVPTFAGAAG